MKQATAFTADTAPLGNSNPAAWLKEALPRAPVTAGALLPNEAQLPVVKAGAIGVMKKPSKPGEQWPAPPVITTQAGITPAGSSFPLPSNEIAQMLSGLQTLVSKFQFTPPRRKDPGVSVDITWYAHDVSVSDDCIMILTPLANTTIPKMATGVIQICGQEYPVAWLNLVGEFERTGQKSCKVVTFVRTS
jgi:hypothetical protein